MLVYVRVFLLVLVFLASSMAVGCNGRVQLTPVEQFNSLSARAGRVATVYAPAALDALPLLGAELKWDGQKTETVRVWIVKVRDSAAAVSQSLGKIADSAITREQRLAVGPLLSVIGDGLTQLDSLGLFGSVEKVSTLEAGVRVSALALKTVGWLMAQQ
jgi:hypothetical protein